MTQLDLPTVIGDLVSVNHRLTRLAATVTGNTESPAVWRTLSVLRDLGPMRLGELAKVSRVTQPTMTKLVHALDERGWIRRIVDRDDARAMLISADPHGIAALDAWRIELANSLTPTFADLDDDELETLASAVEIVRTRLERSRAALVEAAASTGHVA
ncbi:MarR family winged helix-turn-helix transcriptional regulator [Agromyces cerinus]|uniref:Transcriptional regulator, MarR family n=1 Tax=Agromyces cerinus subsp. cerinus TaxID=232089 RepID=A0A1N6ICY3_9MICO|nr:MarR family transcriptional regulator [Agromyces cerinus]SIO29872.1 transcriptional regulator, MarR family [Agromyces cerinus subsp. cerinus]